jgi:hypothetical protein
MAQASKDQCYKTEFVSKYPCHSLDSTLKKRKKFIWSGYSLVLHTLLLLRASWLPATPVRKIQSIINWKSTPTGSNNWPNRPDRRCHLHIHSVRESLGVFINADYSLSLPMRAMDGPFGMK